jgi:hypothetical protein
MSLKHLYFDDCEAVNKFLSKKPNGDIKSFEIVDMSGVQRIVLGVDFYSYAREMLQENILYSVNGSHILRCDK